MQQLIRRICGLILVALASGACGTVQPRPATPSSLPPTASVAEPTAPAAASRTITFAAAQSIALAAGPDGRVYAAVGADDALAVAHAGPDGGWSALVPASGDQSVLVNPVERPAIAITPGGQPALAWIDTGASGQTSLWYAQSADRGASFGAASQVAVAAGPETAMVSIAFDRQQNPLAVWLDGGDLSQARSSDGGRSFAASPLDTAVCDCCQPVPLLAGDALLVAFRNVVRQGENDLRDIYVAHLDAGDAQADPVPVSDVSWQINACPISGPALALAGDAVYVAWMDGRAVPEHSGTRSDIWLARSSDGGRSFGPNLQVNPPQGVHTLPALAAGPDGRLHLSWLSVIDRQHSIVYTSSADGGASFAPLQTIASSADSKDRGRPGAPSLAVTSAGQVYLAWTDLQGAHVVALANQ